MKNLIFITIYFLTTCSLSAQKAEGFGFRHFQIIFEHDTVDILISSQKGEENKRKPLFFYVQGSLAVPLIVHNGEKRVSYTSMVEGFVEK